MAKRKRNLKPEEKQYLLNLKKQPNEDHIRYKEIIKQALLEDDILIWLLNNKELEDADAENDEYYGVNIRPEFMIPETQSNVQNYVCFETSFEDTARYNSAMKYQDIIFYILCNDKTSIVPEIGAARHDLIAGLLIDKFNGCNLFGNQLKLVSNKPSVTDTHYSTRTLTFEQVTTNSLKKADGRTFNLRK